MTSKRHFEEEDLAAFALHSLEEREESAIALSARENLEVRNRLASLQNHLGAYAEVAIDLHEVPEGGFDRFMARIAIEKQSIPFPKPPVESSLSRPGIIAGKSRRTSISVVPWIGWAVAAGLAVGVGTLYQKQAALHDDLQVQTATVSRMAAESRAAAQERDALSSNLAEQTNRVENLSAETASVKSDRQNLQSAVAGQAARLNAETTEKARVEAQSSQLRATVAAQARQAQEQQNEVARLATDAAQARQVLDSLSDRTALRVTLTKPKSRPTPSARATYVPSRGTLVFLANDLASLKPGKVYQLWLMPADGSNPIPEGTFAPDARGSANLVYAQIPRSAAAKGFSVTIENAGGSQTPTLPIILAGVAGS